MNKHISSRNQKNMVGARGSTPLTTIRSLSDFQLNRNCSAPPQMHEIDLRDIAALCKQVYGKANAVLPGSYLP